MKIVSDFKDYYDFYANDRNLSDQTYRWDREMVFLEPNFSTPKSFYHKCDLNTEVFGFMICFCGRLIPVIAIDKDRNDKTYHYEKVPDEILSTGRKGLFFRKEIKDLMEVVNHPWKSILPTGTSVPRIPLLEMHRKINSPVFVCGLAIDYSGKVSKDYYMEDKVVVNPRLKDIGFDKFMDGFQAFQELDRFVSNELAPVDNRNVVVPDKLKAESHGFDKFSFRKDKQV